MEKVYFLFSNCLPVKGANRSIICDLQRAEYDFIPNSLYEILESYQFMSIDEVFQKYSIEYKKTIEEYFEFLEQKEYIFFTIPFSIFLKWI